MKQDKETRIKLLASAREEFLREGYMKASLRNICKNAGVTTGALYFFFKDKADLYDCIVKDTVDGIKKVMNEHFMLEYDLAKSEALGDMLESDNSRDFEDTMNIIHILYGHREDVIMLLTKSQGSPYEGVLNLFIETAEKHYENMARQMERIKPQKQIDNKLMHWLAHQMIEVFVYMITHIEEEQQAMQFMEQSVSYMVAGWYGLFKK